LNDLTLPTKEGNVRLSNFKRKMGFLVTFAPDIWGTQVSYFYTKAQGIPSNAQEWFLCAYVD
jgi:hypothetical protein